MVAMKLQPITNGIVPSLTMIVIVVKFAAPTTLQQAKKILREFWQVNGR